MITLIDNIRLNSSNQSSLESYHTNDKYSNKRLEKISLLQISTNPFIEFIKDNNKVR